MKSFGKPSFKRKDMEDRGKIPSQHSPGKTQKTIWNMSLPADKSRAYELSLYSAQAEISAWITDRRKTAMFYFPLPFSHLCVTVTSVLPDWLRKVIRGLKCFFRTLDDLSAFCTLNTTNIRMTDRSFTQSTRVKFGYCVYDVRLNVRTSL